MPFDKLNHKDDCDCLDICSSLGTTYNLCYAGASYAVDRCSIAEKTQIRLLNKISKQLDTINNK